MVGKRGVFIVLLLLVVLPAVYADLFANSADVSVLSDEKKELQIVEDMKVDSRVLDALSKGMKVPVIMVVSDPAAVVEQLKAKESLGWWQWFASYDIEKLEGLVKIQNLKCKIKN